MIKIKLKSLLCIFFIFIFSSFSCNGPARTVVIHKNRDNKQEGKKNGSPNNPPANQPNNNETTNKLLEEIKNNQTNISLKLIDTENKYNELEKTTKNVGNSLNKIDQTTNNLSTNVGNIKSDVDIIKNGLNDLPKNVVEIVKSSKILDGINKEVRNTALDNFYRSHRGESFYDFTDFCAHTPNNESDYLKSLSFNIVNSANDYLDRSNNPDQSKIDKFIESQKNGLLMPLYTVFRAFNNIFYGSTQQGNYFIKPLLNSLGANAKLFDRMKEEDVHKLLHAISVSPGVEKDGGTWVYDIAAKKCV